MTIVGKDHPIQIRSDGTNEGTRIRVRGADGEWHPLPGVMSAVITIDASDTITRVALTMVNVEVEIESEAVTITPHSTKGA